MPFYAQKQMFEATMPLRMEELINDPEEVCIHWTVDLG